MNIKILILFKLQNKTLLGCPKKDLTDFTMADDFVTLINFKEFKHSSKKNRVNYFTISLIIHNLKHLLIFFILMLFFSPQNFSVKEMFIRQLVQLKNLSVEKAIAIVGQYQTPQALIQACRFGGHEAMFADIPCLGTATCRSVGPVTSKAVHYVYSTERLH